VRELIQPGLLDAIRRHEVEFGIGPSLEDSNEFEFRPVFEDPYVALLPEKHAIAERSEIALSELAGMPILAWPLRSFMSICCRRSTRKVWRSNLIIILPT